MKNSGFTLIELMIVIAIVVIAGSTILPPAMRFFTGTASHVNTSVNTSVKTPVSNKQAQCVNGFLFTTQPNGKLEPAVSNGQIIKC